MDREALQKVAALNQDPDAANNLKICVRSAGASGHVYASAIDKFVAHARNELAALELPGLTFCLVDGEGFAAVGTLGWADKDRQLPVDPGHLFQIGSISKSFAALCVYRLADEGEIDLDAPLSSYLPDAPLPAEPICLQQVLSHTSGLPVDAPAAFPRVPGERLWTGFAPGSRYSYSNTGYELLGMLVEKVTGKPYPVALRELVTRPLGISAAGLREAIQASERAHYAIGYSPLDFFLGPALTRMPVGQVPWVNWTNPASCIGATADAMAHYVKYLLAVGQGRGAPLFSDATARRFATPVVTDPGSEGFGHASGLQASDLDGHAVLQHGGSMLGFSSHLMIDPVSGVGCFANVNLLATDYDPSGLVRYACKLLRHSREGGAAPTSPDAAASDHVEAAESYAGTYFGPEGNQFQLVARTGRLSIVADDREGRLHAARRGGFQSDHPRYGRHLFDFERGGGAVTGAWFGPTLYGRGAPVPQPIVPPELLALQGLYVSEDPRVWAASIVVQKGCLVLERYGFQPGKTSLERNGDYWHSTDAPCERIRFLGLQDGVPRCLNISGRPDLWRFDRI
ncbi:serine hydrolase [Bradyrhizobium arachidis]|uniref:serine hydrolase domain-containing protein n=1 Tax=Bradyrhizobium arachidis TaxID=858423 RepID=UPI002163AB01|nr:serine hydrolase domain-containing protein [Bradyrhizobium arachidis]UVO30471.1 beta-lactamase family protein [Bradyrhizobium arachidis]